MRAATGLAALLLLGACATEAVRTATTPEKPNIGLWRLDRHNDPISGTQVTTASLHISRLEFLPGRFFEGALQLGCFKNEPVVRVRFNRRIGSERNAALAYRFDEQPGRYVNATFFARDSIMVIDRKAEVMQFVAQLQSAENLFLRVTRLRGGTITAKFSVHGASHAIEAAYAECPVATDKPKIRTSEMSRIDREWSAFTFYISATRAQHSPPRAV